MVSSATSEAVNRLELWNFRRASALQKSREKTEADTLEADLRFSQGKGPAKIGEEAGHRGQEGPGVRGQLISTEFVKQSSLFYF